jgi:hypothetical protein
MRAILILYALIFMSYLTVAQEKSFEEKMKMEVDSKDYSWGFKNVFFDFKIAIASEYFIVPDKEYLYLEPDYPGDNTPDSVYLIDNGLMYTIAGLTFEPRINLLKMQEASVFIKAPLSLNFSITNVRNDRMAWYKGKGFFHMTLPVLVGYSRGLNSSFTNTDNRGFAISGGVQLMRAPLIGGKIGYTGKSLDGIAVGDEYELRNNWIMPVVQFDYYKLSKKTKIKGFSLIASVHNHFYFRVALTVKACKK